MDDIESLKKAMEAMEQRHNEAMELLREQVIQAKEQAALVPLLQTQLAQANAQLHDQVHAPDPPPAAAPAAPPVQLPGVPVELLGVQDNLRRGWPGRGPKRSEGGR
ncbi:hypothetical protein CEUSTIGMA_g6004.t1 [Chlamydomonas eustigma]|uniref:Uncharacterized protein n=1 Tax=Chlamydomonas eustigma TaxID=1157962 RepID=A0A250X657_9CHLO|nr:hypothetical protein CEUSTIGMA_g6004.t1 [Chlamydomonas eustigma]|eukprot:GAX78564.1 hypothetical protein CEUSTIGMA_g6004.t1 [Chlamydomonas eustigma]